MHRTLRHTSETPYSPFIMVDTVSAVPEPLRMHFTIWHTEKATA